MGDQAEGIFRKSGSPEAVKQLRQAYLQGRAPFLRQVDVHDIADALKAYLRNLDEPLLTYRLYPLFIDVGRRLDRMSDEQIFEDLHRTLAELPPIYFFSAWYILRLLHRYAACHWRFASILFSLGKILVVERQREICDMCEVIMPFFSLCRN